MVIEWLTLWESPWEARMCHHTTIHKAAHLSPIGLMGPVRTGPYFLALANILHPYRVGARGCSGHRLLKSQKRSKSLLSNFLKSAFSEVHTPHSPGPNGMRRPRLCSARSLR